jgi:exonuclease III
MHTLLKIWLFFWLASNPVITQAQVSSEQFDLVWWNVENLFDTANDSQKHDDDFTPSSAKKWTEKRLEQKLKKLAGVLKSMARKHTQKKLPEIMGFCEVEHLWLLEQLFQEHLNNTEYGFVYHESSDRRGIDIGFAYNKNTFTLISLELISYQILGKTGREILAVRFAHKHHHFMVYGNHWPSRHRNKQRSERWRVAAARALKRHLDSLRLAEPNLDMVIMGDFNDEPHNASLAKTLKATSITSWRKDPQPGSLINLYESDYKKGSYIFNNQWKQFDQILITPGLLDSSGYRLKANSFAVFYTPGQFNLLKSGRVKSIFRTYNGKRYMGGISDHLPLKVTLELVNP